MAHDSINNSRRRTSNPEHRDGGSGERRRSSAGKHIQHPYTASHLGSHEQAARSKTTSSLNQAQQPDRDTPTSPIDVPFSEYGNQRHFHDQYRENERNNMDEDTDKSGQDLAEQNGEQAPVAGSAGMNIPNQRQAGQQPPKLQVRTRAPSRSILDQIAIERAGGSVTAGTSRRERSTTVKPSPMASSVPEEAVDSVPPLSESMKGASPPIEDLPTPAQEVYDSPLAASPSQSPGSASNSWYSRKYGESRKSSSLRRTRRSTASSVSQSPAAEFLRKYSTNSTPRSPPIDSEGVEIGDYVLGREIGSGGFSLVREAFSSTSPSATPTLAVKIVRKQIKGHTENENETLQAQFEHEIEVWKPLQHINILRMHDSIGTKFATFAFMPLVRGGSLWDAVKDSKAQGLEMRLVRRYAAQLAQALRYLHQDMRLVHRDVKLENCLLEQRGAHGRSEADAYFSPPRLLLADFGLAEYIPQNSVSELRRSEESSPTSPGGENKSTARNATEQEGPAGSLPYAAPELLLTKKTPPLSPKVDIWAYGVLLYALVVGRMPFQHSFTPKLVEIIKSCDFDRGLLRSRIDAASSTSPVESTERPTSAPSQGSALFRNESWARSVSTIVPTEGIPVDGDDVMEVIDGCLNTKPYERWDVSQLMEAAWFSDDFADELDGGLDMGSR